MATKVWKGDAAAVAQVTTLTPGGTIESTDIWRVTINGKTVEVTSGGTTATTVCTALYAALLTAAENIPEFGEITWTNGGTVITATGQAGIPFTLTFTTVETGGGAADAQTATATTTTAATGPNHYNDATNWSTGTVPVAADDVFIAGGSDILYGLSNGGATLTSFTVQPGFSGRIGLPYFNEAGYKEYRDTLLRIDASTVTIDSPSGMIKLDMGGVATNVILRQTGSPSEEEHRAFQLKGSSVTSVTATQANWEGAPNPGDTLTLTTYRQGSETSPDSDVDCLLRSGVTVTTIEKHAGKLVCENGCGTCTHFGGELEVIGGGGTQLNVRGGTVYWSSTGTLGGNTIVSGDSSVALDFSKDPRPKTVTNPIERYGEAKVKDPYKTVTSLVVDSNESNLVGLELGTNVRVTRGTPA